MKCFVLCNAVPFSWILKVSSIETSSSSRACLLCPVFPPVQLVSLPNFPEVTVPVSWVRPLDKGSHASAASQGFMACTVAPSPSPLFSRLVHSSYFPQRFAFAIVLRPVCVLLHGALLVHRWYMLCVGWNSVESGRQEADPTLPYKGNSYRHVPVSTYRKQTGMAFHASRLLCWENHRLSSMEWTLSARNVHEIDNLCSRCSFRVVTARTDTCWYNCGSWAFNSVIPADRCRWRMFPSFLLKLQGGGENRSAV